MIMANVKITQFWKINIADNIILMNNGRVEKTGLFSELVNNMNVSTACCKLGGKTNG